jgi:hypothetical protein
MCSLCSSWPGKAKHYPLDLPDPIEAIKYYMEQKELSPHDPIPIYRWSRSRALTLKFKRGQIEQSLALLVEPGSAKPSKQLRTLLKRLLDTDRALGRNGRSRNPEKADFAFYDGDPPGKGAENWFSEYDAFALLTGLRLMQHGWPQAAAVVWMRRLKPKLKAQHARILKQDIKLLFNEELIAQRARPGVFAVGNTDPVFLVFFSQDKQSTEGLRSAAVCRGQDEAVAFINAHGLRKPWTMIELVNSARTLSLALGRTRPRKRGRGAG